MIPSTARHRGATALAAAAAALLAALPLPASAAPREAPNAAGHPATASADTGSAATGAPRTVTLLTGDRVEVTTAGGRTTTEVTGPDGRPAAAHVMRQGEEIRVFPDAVLPYLASGALDPRLFDVTELLADGYDDARSDHLPLIVSYTDAAYRSRATAVPKGARRVRALHSVQGAALAESHASAPVFWAALTGRPAAGTRTATPAPAPVSGTLAGGIAKVWLDGKVRAALSDSTAQIGAPEVWQGGDTGQGVDVAVLDTGIDAGHPDFAGRIAATASFVPGEDVTDRFGHGTYVASVVAGTGAASGGTERGVAPGASLHIGKVLGDDGVGQDSSILAGMEWAAEDQHARIVSMSLGGDPSDGTDPLSQAVDRLSAETGALFVIAAGNSGPDASTVSAPAAADAALAVGAVDGADRLASFSSRGPRPRDGGLKPDLTAPGVDVVGARSQYLPTGEGHYRTESGTSVATPHVAGAAALLARAHPDWSGRQLKDALVSTAKATPQYSPYMAGSGRLDVAAAVTGTVFATGSVFASAAWPYPADGTVRADVTYTNTGSSPVTLDLTVRAPGAPAGLFALSAPRVTVPARGTASVGVLTSLGAASEDTSYSGFVEASDSTGVVRAHSVVGAHKESRKFSLSVRTRARDGAGLAGTLVLKDITRDTVPQVLEVGASGRRDLKVPPGTYAAWLYADVRGLDGPHSLGRAVLGVPEIAVGEDRDVVLDAKDLRRIEAVTPKATTSAYLRIDQYRSYDDLVPFYDGYQLQPWPYDGVWATPTPKVTRGSYTFATRWRQVQPPLSVSAGSHPYGGLLMQSMSPKFPAGSGSHRAVDAHDGSAADFTRVSARGRVAVVRRNDDVPPVDQAANAATAGARLLIVVNDGFGPLDAWADLPGSAPLPVASLGADEGADLLARLRHGTTMLRVDSHPCPAYLYDLTVHHDGSVPHELSYRPGPGDLARIDESMRDTRQGEAITMRYDLSPDRTWAVGSPTTTVLAQGSHTAWVTAGPDAVWLDAAAVPDLTETGRAVGYAPRTTTEATWFAPVQHPRLLGDSVLARAPARTGDLIALYGLPAFGDSGGHAGVVFDAGTSVRAALYQGSTPIAAGDDLINAEVAPDTLPYRLVEDTARDLPGRPYSTRTHTEWEFVSGHLAATTQQVLPLVQLDYAVSTDLAGRARRRTEVAVTPAHLAGTTARGFATVTLDVSYDDGATWHRAQTARGGDGRRFRISAPSGARFVTLRAAARDDRGSRVTQTVVRAFGLE